MSQIHYDTTSPKHGEVHVQTGWDPTMRGFHVTVWTNDEIEDVVVDEMLEPHMPVTITRVIEMLNDEQIPVPECLPIMLAEHQLKNEGNTIVTVECAR